jgi:alanine-synthesizing transaminase
VKLDPETEVIATIGSKEGFSHLCLALLGPGDTAIVPDPAFPIHCLRPGHGRGQCAARAAGE